MYGYALVCMLEDALGFSRGEIIVIKTAGNSVTQPIDNIVQSLLSSYVWYGD